MRDKQLQNLIFRNISPQYFLKKCGYIEIRNPHKNQEVSYARSLDTGRFYPRFHIYLTTEQSKIIMSLHLDAKKTKLRRDNSARRRI